MIEVKEEIKNENVTRSVQKDKDVTVILKKVSVIDVESCTIHLTMGVKKTGVREIRGRRLRQVSLESDISSTMIGVRVRLVTILKKQTMMKSRKKSSYPV